MNKTCQQCGVGFEITEDDLKFYEQVSPVIRGEKFLVPPPTHCPDCRQQRRLAFRNERKLYLRKCDLCTKTIISVYSSDKPFKVFCTGCWWSDKRDDLAEGIDFDFNKSFFDQFYQLKIKVPRPNLSNTFGENSDYCNEVAHMNNCYLVVGSNHCKNCFYSSVMIRSSDCADCLNLTDCELCFECIDCQNCYNCKYAVYCKNVADSSYVFNCFQSKNLLFCVGIKNAEYQILNRQYPPEEFLQKKQEIFSDAEVLNDYKKKFQELKLQLPVKYMTGVMPEDSSGNWLDNCKNVQYGFEATKVEDCKFVYEVWDIKNCYDLYCFYGPAQWCYDVYGGFGGDGAMQNLLFTNCCWPGHDILYSDYCFNSNNLFGCIGLTGKKYCIFNKQYSKEEYETLVPKIIAHMMACKEWGEFFLIKISPYGYNESIANEYFPLNKEKALKKGFQWKEDDITGSFQGNNHAVPIEFENIDNEITKNIYECANCKKNYKFLKEEIEMHQKFQEPLSKNCPSCRHLNRRLQRNPRKLWARVCAKCAKPIETSYSPERPEKVYCEECYLKAVY